MKFDTKLNTVSMGWSGDSNSKQRSRPPINLQRSGVVDASHIEGRLPEDQSIRKNSNHHVFRTRRGINGRKRGGVFALSREATENQRGQGLEKANRERAAEQAEVNADRQAGCEREKGLGQW